jgi:glycosyltransferase involved in cell wall biosynthesis
MSNRARGVHWVLVSGGFHGRGGMDKANAALAAHLLDRGHPVHLVAHDVDPALSDRSGVTVHRVARPAGSFLAGELLLGRKGREVARRVAAEHPGARVVVNGGCCRWPDVNWVHSLHVAWPCRDEGAPVWFKGKNRLTKALARWRERSSLAAARVVIANSEKTRRDLIRHLGLPASRVYTVHLGSDPCQGPVIPAERAAARQWLGVAADRPIVAFVGALSHDNNKGLDTLFAAWRRLRARPEWDAELIVAGGGNALASWRAKVAGENLGGRVRMLGFTDRVNDLLAAADLLVSPVRYEAYGLNVHEAICRGVPALVSACAGVAELYPAELGELLLPDAEDADDLAMRLLGWRGRLEEWKTRFSSLGDALRARTWERMAEQIVAVAEEGAGRWG